MNRKVECERELTPGSVEDFRTLKEGDVILFGPSRVRGVVESAPYKDPDVKDLWYVETSNGTVACGNTIAVEYSAPQIEEIEL